jgi:hypothetical protein
MRRRSGLPRFVVVLLTIAALMFLGPPLLALVAGLVGLTIGLLAVALKVGVVALGVYAAVLLLKALFGGDPSPRRLPVTTPTYVPPLDDPFDDLERRKDAELAALDRELARTLAQQVK